MNIVYYGGQVAGVVTLLTLLTQDHAINGVIAEDDKVANIAKLFNLQLVDKAYLDDPIVTKGLGMVSDILICCHARKILKPELVNNFPCVNLHPYLYIYKGARPIRRAIHNSNTKASVASHWMVEKVDMGETIVEQFLDIPDIASKSEADVYNILYLYYASVLIETLAVLERRLM